MKKGHGKKTNEHEKGNEKNGKKRNKKRKKNTKTKRKGFEKKRLLTISKVNFECKGGNIAKRKKHNERKRKGFQKKLLLISFDNFQGQFSRQRKEK